MYWINQVAVALKEVNVLVGFHSSFIKLFVSKKGFHSRLEAALSSLSSEIKKVFVTKGTEGLPFHKSLFTVRFLLITIHGGESDNPADDGKEQSHLEVNRHDDNFCTDYENEKKNENFKCKKPRQNDIGS